MLLEQSCDKHFPVPIHSSAVVAGDAVIGEETAIAVEAVICPDARIGKCVIVRTFS